MRRRQDGSFSAEFVAVLPIMVFVAVVAWQVVLVLAAGNSTAAAARNGAREASKGGDVAATVERSLPDWVREHSVTREGGRVAVEVTVPLLFPVLDAELMRIERTAEMPQVGG